MSPFALPQVVEHLDTSFDKLDKAIRRRDWKRHYLLTKAGIPGLYHLGEDKSAELHLIGATATEVMDFVDAHAPRMFRFAAQTSNWRWMHYLHSEWFSGADSTNKPNVKTDTWAYWEISTPIYKSQFNHNDLPYYPGIYVVANACYATPNPEILYVGKAQKDISARWRCHHKAQEIARIAPLIHIHCFNAAYLIFDDLREAEILFSRQLQPLLNKRIG